MIELIDLHKQFKTKTGPVNAVSGVGFTAQDGGLHLVVEGRAAACRDPDRLWQIAALYQAKYAWNVRLCGECLEVASAEGLGPSPHVVFQVQPEAVFGFGLEASGPTAHRYLTEEGVLVG